jgi:polyisoprenoid-binding protein YceI
MEMQTLGRVRTRIDSRTTWRIDPAHSMIGFSIKHMKFATVRGRFSGFEGTIRTDEWPSLDPLVDVKIDASTIDTGEKRRDEHLRSADFFDVSSYPTIEFRSTRVEPVRPMELDRWLVAGNLTIRGTTRPVKLAVERTSAGQNPWLTESTTFAATTMIRRKDFGIGLNFPLEGLGIVIGDDVTISIVVRALSKSIEIR